MANPTISISYLPVPIKNPVTFEFIEDKFYPFVNIRISYREKLSISFEALVDSGSDRNLFPAYFGEMIGLNFKQDIPKIIIGIGGVRIKAYTKAVKIYLYGHVFDSEIDFSYQQDMFLLGRDGFFNLLKSVKFKEKDRFLDLEF